MFTKALYGLGLLLLPTVVLGVPLPRPCGSVEYQVTARNVPLGEKYPEVPFKATRHPDWLLLQRDGGDPSIEVVLGSEIQGDFVANIEVEIAGYRALGIRPNGGTPVPYFGFRTTNGKDAEYFSLNTAMTDWEGVTFEISRKGATVSANRYGYQYRNSTQGCPGPGYLMFFMNDIAKLKILRFEVRGIPQPDPFALK